MSTFEYSLIKVCHRAGREYYHIYPERPIGKFPKNFEKFNVKIRHPEFYVLAFPDCNVTVFKSGRMLVEDLPENSEARVRQVIEEITTHWLE